VVSLIEIVNADVKEALVMVLVEKEMMVVVVFFGGLLKKKNEEVEVENNIN